MLILNDVGYAESFNLQSVQNLSPYYGAQMTLIQNLSFVPATTAVGYNQNMLTQASYRLMAHEMAHVLGNLMHVALATPNLMNAGDGDTPQAIGHMMSSALTPSQCQAIRAFNNFY
jgi:hypothetical protein